MKYDKTEYEALANKRVFAVWTMMCVVLCSMYWVQVLLGNRTVSYVLTFMAFCLTPYLVNLIVAKIRGWHSRSLRWVTMVGYSVFFAYVMATCDTPLSCLYMLPIAAFTILYEDKKVFFTTGVIHVVTLMGTVFLRKSMNFTFAEAAIMVAGTMVIYASFAVAMWYLIKKDAAVVGDVQANFEAVKNTVDKVKIASEDVVDGVDEVKELSAENQGAISEVSSSMHRLEDVSSTIQNCANNSTNLIFEVNEDVDKTSELIADMVAMTEESMQDAKNSVEQLSNTLASAQEMSDIAAQLHDILNAFKDAFVSVKRETGVIDAITSQTNLLSLNASIEAARAGEAGRGFSVVAGEIRNLADDTKKSALNIAESLQSLQTATDQMDEYITKTLALIDGTITNVADVESSVNKISDRIHSLGDNAIVINEAMGDVRESNNNMSKNTEQMTAEVEEMIAHITEVVASMDSVSVKIEETNNSVIHIENTVNRLVADLGEGGFLGVDDIPVDAHVTLKNKAGRTYRAIVKEVRDGKIIVEKVIGLDENTEYDIAVIVNSKVYGWSNADVVAGTGEHMIIVEGNPEVINRRKYERVSINAPAEITCKNHKINAKMENICAGGLGFVIDDESLNAGDIIEAVICNNTFSGETFKAKVLRRVSRGNSYYIACSLFTDSDTIAQYVARVTK